MTCTKLKDLLKAELGDLTLAINKHKYYLSQKHNFDVGWSFAEKDYLQNHLNDWCTGWKDCYCKHVCDEVNCEYHLNK